KKAGENLRGRNLAILEMDMADGIGGGRGDPRATGLPMNAPGAAMPLADLQKAQGAVRLAAEEREGGKLDRLGEVKDASGAPNGPGASAPITKVREYFPETMLWMPN